MMLNADKKLPMYIICKPLAWIYYHLLFKIEVQGIENIPMNDGAIICPNHTAKHDPVITIISTPRQIRFMAKSQIFKNPIIAHILKSWGVYSVKRGETDINAAKMTLKLLKNKQLIGIFPEGTRMKDGVIGNAHAGVSMFSIKSCKPVIPVYINSNYKLFSKIKIIYGEPIDFEKYRKERMTNNDYLELSQIVMDSIKKIKVGSV